MTKFLLAILATYRAAQLISVDDGPLEVFRKFRQWAGRLSHRGSVGRSFADLVHCPYCVGMWVAGLLAVWIKPGNVVDWLVHTLAIAGGQAYLQALTEREV